jgi:uncharacterized peroxidase-related enzyme
MRIPWVSEADANDAARAVFQRARQRYGWLPNTVRVMAHGSAAADLYLTAGELNSAGTLSAVERELLAVLVATHNGCTYCRTAHGLAAQALRVDATAVLSAARASSTDPRIATVLGFAAKALALAGRLTDDDVASARRDGLDDTTMLDIVSVIAENVLGNTVNNLAQTTVDPLLEQAARRFGDIRSEAR